ncbi:MAG: GNAT family N-acetyltransferase [Chromatiales bacterium]|nr:GNAT family N-acetyltransferase [Chromatiales bacterium]
MNGPVLRIEALVGDALTTHLEDLARLRIEVFRDFPYLYDGDPGYEARYLRTYVEAPGSMMVLVFDGETVVGASTCIPLQHETAEIRRPFERQGWDVARVFYLGESVLQRAYRGRGLGVRFFEAREAHARRLGGFEHAAFCGVQRPADHPRRPGDYVPLDTFWSKRGYERRPELTTTLSWKDLDEPGETPKPMQFWTKPL